MKVRHNKKRNTAFLYESLIKELTKTIIKKQNKRKQRVLFFIETWRNIRSCWNQMV